MPLKTKKKEILSQRKTKFSTNYEEKSTVIKWIKTQFKDFYAENIVFLYEKCVLKNGREKISG